MKKSEAYSWLTQPGIKATLFGKFSDSHTKSALNIAINNLSNRSSSHLGGPQFVNNDTAVNMWSVDKIVDITTKIKAYADEHDYRNVALLKVMEDSNKDVERYNIEIAYVNTRDLIVHQMLYLLNGEVVDGKELRKRLGLG